jgi:hypothetical protein
VKVIKVINICEIVFSARYIPKEANSLYLLKRCPNAMAAYIVNIVEAMANEPSTKASKLTR